jgi:hypothetical protein
VSYVTVRGVKRRRERSNKNSKSVPSSLNPSKQEKKGERCSFLKGRGGNGEAGEQIGSSPSFFFLSEGSSLPRLVGSIQFPPLTLQLDLDLTWVNNSAHFFRG